MKLEERERIEGTDITIGTPRLLQRRRAGAIAVLGGRIP